MSERSLFDNVSPLDFRYYGQDEALQQLLDPYVTEAGRVRSEAMVEAAATRVLARRGICSAEVTSRMRSMPTGTETTLHPLCLQGRCRPRCHKAAQPGRRLTTTTTTSWGRLGPDRNVTLTCSSQRRATQTRCC